MGASARNPASTVALLNFKQSHPGAERHASRPRGPMLETPEHKHEIGEIAKIEIIGWVMHGYLHSDNTCYCASQYTCDYPQGYRSVLDELATVCQSLFLPDDLWGNRPGYPQVIAGIDTNARTNISQRAPPPWSGCGTDSRELCDRKTRITRVVIWWVMIKNGLSTG
jgi:hypothetical protein